MAVTEVLRAVGSWELALTPETPQNVWDVLQYYGHVAIHSGPIDIRVAGDSALDSARYIGVLRRKVHEDNFLLGGGGMALWLGDEDGKGWVIETPLAIAAQTLENATRLILPPASSAILEGSYFALPGNPTFTSTFQWVTQREALNYLTDTLGAEWKVLGTGRLHVGPEGSLFVTSPKALIVRRDQGADLTMRAFPGALTTEQSIDDFTTRVVLLATDDNGSVATADADILPGLNLYKDLFGNSVHLTRLVGESSTDFANAGARAQLQLNRFTNTTDALTLSTEDYDVKGTVAVGDYLWVYDPEHKLVDTTTEIVFRGMRLNPLKLRLTEMTWPVVEGMHVAYRDGTGVWTDLTPFIEWETGTTTLVVGGFTRRLGDGADGGGGLGPRPNPQPNTTIPNAPTWVTPFLQGVYQSTLNGDTKSQTELRWNQPTNTDSSAINDGDYYEVRYRTSTTPLFPVTHAQMAVYTHAQLTGTFGNPIVYPVTDWQYTRVPFTELRTILYELTPTMPYEAQIRVVDNGTPANAGAWSVLTQWQTADDTLGPATPAAPTVASSLIGVQITHNLGRADGGTFNLDRDLHHLEVHGLFEPLQALTPTTLLGRGLANAGMLIGQIPLVAKFQIDSISPLYYKVVAVDVAGNKSPPSPHAVATAELIDDAHIASLTVNKITAGTMTASWVMAGEFMTGFAGPRAGFDFEGFYAQNAAQQFTFIVDSATGNVDIVGKYRTQFAGDRVELNPAWAHPSGGTRPVIQAFDEGAAMYMSMEAFGGTFQIVPRRVSDNLIVGGHLFCDLASDGSGSAYLSYLNQSNGNSWYYQVGSNGAHHLKGFFQKNNTIGGLGALYVDQVGGSGTSASVSYGATFATIPLPFVEIQGTSGSPPTANAHAVTARSATGFSIQYPAGNCDIFVWAVRFGT